MSCEHEITPLEPNASVVLQLHIGDVIIVCETVMDVEHPSICLAGWRGTVSAIDVENKAVVVEWDWRTAFGISEEILRSCHAQSVDWTSMVLGLDEVELCPHGNEGETTLALHDEDGKRQHSADLSAAIQAFTDAALKGVDRRDRAACFRAWYEYLRLRMGTQFVATVLDDPFTAHAISAGTTVIVERLGGLDPVNGLRVEVLAGTRKSVVSLGSLRPIAETVRLLPVCAYLDFLSTKQD